MHVDPITDQRLLQLAEGCGFASWRAALLRSSWVLSVGTLLGTFFGPLTPPQAWYEPSLGALRFGATLWFFYVILEIAALAASNRIARFDRRVQSALHIQSSAIRAIPASICLFGLSAISIAFVGAARATALRPMITAHAVAGVALVIIAWIIWARIARRPKPIDWATSQLCRRCGYDRGPGIHNCPECSETAINA